MHIGEQLHAPHGFECLATDTVYHFLFSDDTRNRTLLVTFGAKVDTGEVGKRSDADKRQAPRLLFLPPHRFEDAIRAQMIIACPIQRELPHWFGPLTVDDLLEHDRCCGKNMKSHDMRIDALLAHIWPAVNGMRDVLGAEDPMAQLNALARSCVPPQNETRYRIAFFSYVAFGMERMALHYPIARMGIWDRSTHEKKFGRAHILGKDHGYRACTDEIRDACIEGFREYSGSGKHVTEIYRKTLASHFGCTPIQDTGGRMSFANPTGKAFPSEAQFRYIVSMEFDLHTRQVLKFGAHRVRTKLSQPRGQFIDSVANAMEELVEDGYFLSVVSQGYLKGSQLPRLCVVRIICKATGLIVGIGFSLKGESADAYRMAKACMAVDKVWFCSLFGVKIRHEEWPSIGLPLHELTDRGAGATDKAYKAIGMPPTMIKEIVSAYSGQSKASVETRHPKEVKQEGAPQYRSTGSTIPELAAQEIWRVIESNRTTNIALRLPPDAIAAGVQPTPVAFWNYLTTLGRTFAIKVPRDRAVRAFFEEVDLTVQDGAVFFHGFRYWSEELAASGILTRASSKVRGYTLPVCVRHIFLDTAQGLLTVDAAFGIRVGEEERYLSVSELEQLHELRRREAAALKIHQQAVRADIEQRFEEQTGKSYDQADIQSGRAKRNNAASVEEARQTLPHLKRRGGGR